MNFNFCGMAASNLLLCIISAKYNSQIMEIVLLKFSPAYFSIMYTTTLLSQTMKLDKVQVFSFNYYP